MSSRLIRATVTAVVAGVCAAGLLTGCAPEPHETPTPTPRFTSEAQAFQAAEETYRAYVDALNNVDLADPSTFEDVYKWETGDALDSDKKVLTEYHAEGATMSGSSVVTVLDPALYDDALKIIKLNVCLDVSQQGLVDSSGNSLVDPDRGDTHSTTVTLDESQASSTGFLVSGISGRKGEPKC